MIKRLFSLFFISIFAIGLHAGDRILFNNNWKFKKLDTTEINSELSYLKIKNWILPTSNQFRQDATYSIPIENLNGGIFSKTEFDDSSWRSLSLPHDWGIEGPFVQEYPGETAKLPWFGVAWYRKQFDIPAADKGKQIYLEIDGAMSFSTVWCNGNLVGGWPYGYSSYKVDLTPFIKYGEENTLAIRLDNPKESSRWYPGGGIYRNVWLTINNPIHIDNWGTNMRTVELSDTRAILELDIDIVNSSNKNKTVIAQTDLYQLDTLGNPILDKVIASSQEKINLVDKDLKITQRFKVDNPNRWDIESPNMYVAQTVIKEGNKTLDTYNTKFGIRSIEFTTKDGFHLNGRRVQLNGVCMHSDFGALGVAFNYRAQERQLELLQEMGVNAIRTSHNPPAPEMLELCDKMGILVIDEFVDTWIMPKKKNGYALLFNDWHEADVRSAIRRDRNHPSIIMWSTGNEVGEQHTKEGQTVSQMLRDIVHQEDDSRLATIGCDNPDAAFNGFENTTDIFGFNYKPHLYEKFEKENPSIPFYGSETESAISTRGEYLFPVTDNQNGGKIGLFMSSYDLYAVNWGCIPDKEFKAQEQAPGSAGQFTWTGFDYLGEPTPFTSDLTVLTNYHDPEEKAKAEKELERMGKIVVPSRSSYFGIIDLAGFKKDRFYIYQAHWRPDLPMVHILPHWNWEDRIGQITPIHVYTSGDSAELFVNGKSQGLKTKKQYEYRLRWDDVVYQLGEVIVVAYKDGKVWAEEIVKTAQETNKIHLSADRLKMKSDGSDLIFVTADLQDANGNFAPRANNLIKFEIEGPAEIIATDNGDQTSHASFQNPYINAFNGKALVILRSKKGEKGEIKLSAKSDNLQSKTIKLRAN